MCFRRCLERFDPVTSIRRTGCPFSSTPGEVSHLCPNSPVQCGGNVSSGCAWPCCSPSVFYTICLPGVSLSFAGSAMGKRGAMPALTSEQLCKNKLTGARCTMLCVIAYRRNKTRGCHSGRRASVARILFSLWPYASTASITTSSSSTLTSSCPLPARRSTPISIGFMCVTWPFFWVKAT